MVIGFYWPFKGEVDPRVAVLRLRSLGARSALPVVLARGAPLQFREWRPGMATAPGVFGLPVPVDGAIVAPGAVLAPPIGFDAHGFRLGYGGGFFDRTLAAAAPRPLALGLAREAGRIATIHPQPHDIPMDFILTEAGVHHDSGSGLRLVPDLRDVARLAADLLASRQTGDGPGTDLGRTPVR
jgi:5-formyltetrahydrofolate cyclo-ligase